jgi:Protein of unknown function (DUF3309)
MPTILIVILVLLLIGAVPTWPYSRGWGYYPSGLVGLLLLILLILALTGRLWAALRRDIAEGPGHRIASGVVVFWIPRR